jgi:hypothetical protein
MNETMVMGLYFVGVGVLVLGIWLTKYLHMKR